jgi:AcrR family transcriptional regulator
MSPSKLQSERSQRERSEATTRALIEAARERFAKAGYEATSLDDVAEDAGVTKGALYHHFGGKRELFAAVFEHEQRNLAKKEAEAYARERDPWKAFYAGCRAFLEGSLDPGVQRITILEGPAVLGWEATRAIETDVSMGMIEHALRRAIDAGAIGRRPVEPLAHMLFGALCQAATMIARAGDQNAEKTRVLRELRALLDGLR